MLNSEEGVAERLAHSDSGVHCVFAVYTYNKLKL